MQQSQKEAAPLTSCSQQRIPREPLRHFDVNVSWTHIIGLLVVALLAVGLLVGCTEKVVVKPLNVAARYPDKFVCDQGVSGGRPVLPPEEGLANGNFENYKASVRARELLVSGYILALEAVQFGCFNNMQWQKDFYSKLPAE